VAPSWRPPGNLHRGREEAAAYEDDDDSDAEEDGDIADEVQRVLRGGARLTSAQLWAMEGGVTADKHLLWLSKSPQ